MTTATTYPLTAVTTEDPTVVDARAPRFNQATVALLSIVALATGAWPLFGLLALQLGVSVTLGRRYCLPCVFYFKVVRPRLGPGPLEDSRAPRFANLIGFFFLGAATLAYAVGAPQVGFALGAIVAVLASLAVTTGLCVGCEVYRVLAKLRGVRGGSIERVDLETLGAQVTEGSVVLFTHPLCSDCVTLGERLEAAQRHVVKVDVSKHRALAKKYGVSVVPLAFTVAADGRVLGTVK
jgi:hypothetical protein